MWVFLQCGEIVLKTTGRQQVNFANKLFYFGLLPFQAYSISCIWEQLNTLEEYGKNNCV